MLKSFKSKAFAEILSTGNSRRVQPKHLKRLNVILTALDAAIQVRQLALPGMRLHLLEPKKEGRYAVWVDENYRVTFKFGNGDATEVDYEDYH
jgi:toxin HigB-1